MLKVAVGGFHHETNTFNPKPTLLKHFHEYRGSEIVEEFRGTNSVLGGFVDSAVSLGLALKPTIYAEAPLVTGLIVREAFEHYRDLLAKEVAEANPDGVLLFLHGSAVADGYESPESEILRCLKEVLGDDVPIVVGCDYHANVSEEWLQHSDAIVAYKTSPHVDMYERGAEACRILRGIIKGEIEPVMEIEKPPILLKGGLMTIVDTPLQVHKSPFFLAVNRARRYERRDDVVNVSVCSGFGDADVPHAGVSVVATTDGRETLAKEIVEEIGRLLWRMRHGLSPDLVLTPLEEALDTALNLEGGPVILADMGDNPAGGGPADSTFILQALKDYGWPDAALFLKDPEVVAEAVAVGVGGRLETSVGGKTDGMHGRPVRVEGVVETISVGEFYEPLRRRRVRMGRTAVIRCGETEIILTEEPTSQIHPAYFESVGVNPRAKKIVVVKSAHYFRAGFEPLIKPKMILEVDTPGVTNPNPLRFEYKRVRRPIFPLDAL